MKNLIPFMILIIIGVSDGLIRYAKKNGYSDIVRGKEKQIGGNIFDNISNISNISKDIQNQANKVINFNQQLSQSNPNIEFNAESITNDLGLDNDLNNIINKLKKIDNNDDDDDDDNDDDDDVGKYQTPDDMDTILLSTQ